MHTLTPAIVPVKPNTVHAFAAGLYPIDRYRRAPKGGCTISGRFYAGGQFIGNLEPDVPAVEAAPVTASIFGFTYEIERLPVPAEVGVAGFEMRKLGTASSYAVLRDNHGETTCDCPDFAMRKAGTGAMCKHGSKLVEMGLLPPPPRMPLPPFKRRETGAPTIPAPRRRRFEPTTEDNRLAALMFAR